MKYESLGDMDLSEANEMNVPVHIFIEEEEEGLWELSANNYMPRKNFIAEGQYKLQASTKEDLLAALEKYVVPLYEVAIHRLKTDGNLYYWQKEGKD